MSLQPERKSCLSKPRNPAFPFGKKKTFMSVSQNNNGFAISLRSGQEAMTRSLHCNCICKTAFLWTKLFLD